MSRAYVAYPKGLVVTTDVSSRGSGDAVVRLPHRRVECVAVSPAAPERVFAGTFDAGLWRSDDGGETFEPVGEGIDQDAVTALAVSSHDPDTVWAGTEPSRIYRSTDGGDTWRRLEGLADVPSAEEWSFPPRPDTHHVRWIEPSPGDPKTWYVGIEAGAFVVTRDGGKTWTDRPPGSRRDNHTIATNPAAPDRVYSTAGDGYAESTDSGQTWTEITDGLQHRYCWGLAVDPGDPDTVVASASSGARDAHRTGPSYLYRKSPTNDGDRWERLDGATPQAGDDARRAVLASGDDPGELYAACDDGLFRTSDAGDSWEGCLTVADAEGGSAGDGVDPRDVLETGPVRGLAVVE